MAKKKDKVDKYHKVTTGQKKKKGEEFRTITINKNIEAMYNTSSKVIAAYLFDKEVYALKDAKAWVKDHKEDAIHQQLVEIDDLMERRKTQMEDLNQEVYAKVMELVDKD